MSKEMKKNLNHSNSFSINDLNLYYEDINKINEEIRQKRIKEKNKFYEIKNLLEDSYKKKVRQTAVFARGR